jgi:hypothetical protein
MKNKIKYLLDEEKVKKYSEILPILLNELRNANSEITIRQENIEEEKQNLKFNLQDLGTYVNRRNQVMAIIKDLGLIKDTKIMGNPKVNPTERVSVSNPQIVICLSEKKWNKRK